MMAGNVMKAMILKRTVDLSQVSTPLSEVDLSIPQPAHGDVLIRITACGVCHTELDEIEGRMALKLPIVPGHQAVGRVANVGGGVTRLQIGDRVGVAWIFRSCGHCVYCQNGEENLCASFQATGRDAHGGYAQYMVVAEDFAHPIPAEMDDVTAAPLLCAGAIGYRSLRLTGLVDGQSLGLTGFGASGHLVLKLVRHTMPNTPVHVFARNKGEQQFARELGAVWAGHTMDAPPRKLQAIIDTTPAWKPVVEALAHLMPGGRLVINAIRKQTKDQEALLGIDYARHLWMEKEIKSVANVARQDVRAFLALAAQIPIKPHVQTYPLTSANQALMDLKQGRINGAKVLVIQGHDGP
jgi:propanol-preferring alcohol dehydrogenase